jgi:hypothetical protein
VGRGLRGRDDESNVNNIQYKTNWSCHYNPPPYNDYILIKIYEKKIGKRQKPTVKSA